MIPRRRITRPVKEKVKIATENDKKKTRKLERSKKKKEKEEILKERSPKKGRGVTPVAKTPKIRERLDLGRGETLDTKTPTKNRERKNVRKIVRHLEGKKKLETEKEKPQKVKIMVRKFENEIKKEENPKEIQRKKKKGLEDKWKKSLEKEIEKEAEKDNLHKQRN